MLGDELRKERLKAGLTQEELAFKATLSRNYVSLLELGIKSPTIDTLLSLCKALGVSMGEVILRVERAGGFKSKRKR
jgi:transcriptional regulator with XRE-family HTH domain